MRGGGGGGGGGVVGGRGKIECQIFFLAPPPPSPTFYFAPPLQSFIQKDSSRGLNPYYFYVLPCGQKRYSFVINFIEKIWYPMC